MRRSALIGILSAAVAALPTIAAPIYNNLTPNNLMAVASRPDTGTPFEIEAADDFSLVNPSIITSASFIGVIVPGPNGGSSSISDVVAEIYRIFPLDSNTTRTAQVPTRANSPSDVALTSRDSAASQISFISSVLSVSFTALNSVQPGGIHPAPNQRTLGNGPITGQEVQINLTFSTPITLDAGHYFFVPQVSLTNGAQFYWLSASRPISGANTTPFDPDLQAWTRDENLDPDWLRVGTDIVGGVSPPTFNMAFSLDGTVVPEPGSISLVLSGLGLLAAIRRKLY